MPSSLFSSNDMSSSYLLDSEAVGCDEIWCTAFVDEHQVWAGGLDGQLRCFDASKSKESPVVATSSSATHAQRPLGIVALDANESFVVTNQLHSELTRWALDQQQEASETRAIRRQASASIPSNGAWNVSLHPSEEIVATAGSGAQLKLVKASVQGFGETLHQSSAAAPADFASACQFSPDGKWVAVSTAQGQVFLVRPSYLPSSTDKTPAWLTRLLGTLGSVHTVRRNHRTSSAELPR